MKFFKPHFWSKKYNILSIILLPVSLLIQVLFFIKKNIEKKEHFSVPIICVGNIYIGGTGKTPLTIKTSEILSKLGKKIAIIKKFYENQSDEIELIKEKTKSLITGKTRKEAINKAINKKYNTLILDDGFQDYSIKKDLNILCFNSNQLIGNGLTLPSGPLRESLNSVKYCQMVVINGSSNEKFEKKIKSISNSVSIYYTKYLPIGIKRFQNMNLLAFAGIGNSENFFELLSDYKLNIMKKIPFPDHYNYTSNDIKNLFNIAKKNNLRLITTEKDYFRLKYLGLNENINYLSVELNILQEEKFFDEIKKYIK